MSTLKNNDNAHGPENALDKYIETGVLEFYSETNEEEQHAWLEIELLGSYTIVGLLLVNVIDDNDVAANVYVGNEKALVGKPSENSFCRSVKLIIEKGHFQEVFCHEVLEGRFLVIQNKNQGNLAINEILIFPGSAPCEFFQILLHIRLVGWFYLNYFYR